MEDSKIVLIIRGKSGSGKSTLAKLLVSLNPKLSHVESDMFRYTDDGEYVYNKEDNDDVTTMTRRSIPQLLDKSDGVIVSNVFTTIDSVRDYVAIAKQNKAKYAVIKVVGNYGSDKPLPKWVAESQELRWENYSNELKVTADTSIDTLARYIKERTGYDLIQN